MSARSTTPCSRLLATLVFLSWLAVAQVRAQAASDAGPDTSLAVASELDAPYSPLVRQQFYAQLAKRPWRAFGWELLLPGGGNFYTGLSAPGYSTLGLSVLGAGLWIAGAVADRPALMWTGIGTFAAGRTYGLISAPIGALLLNAAFRRQLGITTSY